MVKDKKIQVFKAAASAIKEHRDELMEIATGLTSGGASQDEVIDGVVAAVDALIDWAKIGGALGPVGAAVGSFIETIDGPAARSLVKAFIKKQGKV